MKRPWPIASMCLGLILIFAAVAIIASIQSRQHQEKLAAEEWDDPIVRHSWWRVAMSPDQVKQLTLAIATIPKHKFLFVKSTGDVFYLDGRRSDNPLTLGVLQSGSDNVVIQFAPGRSLLTRSEAKALLHSFVDMAHASEQQFRKTGKGNAMVDQLLDMEPGYSGPPAQ